MGRDDFQAFVKEIQDFAALEDFKERHTQYFAYRRQLNAISKDETLDDQTRMDAYILQNSLKWAFNAYTGIELRKRLSQYPESTLYSGHRTMTGACRNKVATMATQFEFKPTPLVLGVKHYFGKAHGPRH